MYLRHHHESGQILLITLLVLSIATTVALSLIARTTQDTSVGTQLEESARAFNAAEAGIEDALKSGIGSASPLVVAPGVSYTTAVTSIGGAASVYQFPRKTRRGTTDTLWLVAHNSDGTLNETPVFTGANLDICWSQETTTPAVEVSLLYKRSGAYQVARDAYDPDATRGGTNKFTTSGITSGMSCGQANYYKKTLTVASLGIVGTDTLLALRLTPRYSDSRFALDPGAAALPQQGNRLESTGATTTGLTRKIVVYQQYKAPSTIFDAAIYSQGSFSH